MYHIRLNTERLGDRSIYLIPVQHLIGSDLESLADRQAAHGRADETGSSNEKDSHNDQLSMVFGKHFLRDVH